MSLSKWSGVHPYVADRVRYLLKIADRHGGKYSVLSGKRSLQKQWELWDRDQFGPTAFPGCSQHNYGLAMDVAFTDERWRAWFQQAARLVGLTTVPRDAPHVQALPASTIRPLLKQANLCPDPHYDNVLKGRNPGYDCPPGWHHVQIVGGRSFCSEFGSSEEGFSVE